MQESFTVIEVILRQRNTGKFHMFLKKRKKKKTTVDLVSTSNTAALADSHFSSDSFQQDKTTEAG